jgi:hypothetical protein
VTKWGLAGRLSAGLGVAVLMYVGRVCAWFAALLLVFALVEQAWGAVGGLGMASLVGSAACGIASEVYLRRDGSVGRLVLVAVGATVLMALGAVLVAIQLR